MSKETMEKPQRLKNLEDEKEGHGFIGKKQVNRSPEFELLASGELTVFVGLRHLWAAAEAAAEAAAAAAVAVAAGPGSGACASPCCRQDWRELAASSPAPRQRSGPEGAEEALGFMLFFVQTAGSTHRSSPNKPEVFEHSLKGSLMA